MLSILREMWILMVLFASFFCRAIAAIFRGIKIVFEKLDEFCTKLSDAILRAHDQTGYEININVHTESEK